MKARMLVAILAAMAVTFAGMILPSDLKAQNWDEDTEQKVSG